MITQLQLTLAKSMLEQARSSAAQAQESWRSVWRAHNDMLDSLRKAGVPLAEAPKYFETLTEFHSSQYKAALEHMDAVAKAYEDLLAKHRADAVQEAPSR